MMRFDMSMREYLPGKKFRLYAPVAKGMNAWVEGSLPQNDDIIDVVDWHSYSSSHRLTSSGIEKQYRIQTYIQIGGGLCPDYQCHL